MKKIHPSPSQLLSAIALLFMLMITACSPNQGMGASAPVILGNSEAQAAPPDSFAVDRIDPMEAIPASDDPATPDGMVAFEGTVFVALTKPVTNRWQSAGWRIAEQPIDSDAQQAPLDCSLYPHSGVQDQWIGGCRGFVLIPPDGAQHIAVVVTNPDGSSTMVQIAPPPAAPNP